MGKDKSSRRLLTAATLAVIGLALLSFVYTQSRAPDEESPPLYWPTQAWHSVTPEEQGCDSARMATALQSIQSAGIDIHSLLVIRKGMVIGDSYFYPYDGIAVHDQESVTKSVMTTLIAIAADQGKLQLDQPMVSFFPARTIANLDDRKQRITVRHLAGMTSGLESMGFEQDEGSLKEMQGTGDWVQWALDRPVVSEPGTHFVYDSPGMHLLSAILQQATGQTALEYARQNLLGPLGITEVMWMTDPQGHNDGWGHLYLHPRDAAKIGYLWQNGGTWEGRQLVSRQWVQDSVTAQTTTDTNDDYGYGWWIMDGELGQEYAAIGRGGQRVHLLADLDLLVVTTGGGFNIDEIWPYLDGVLVDPEKPLPANPAGVAQLNAAITAVAQPPPAQPVAPLPPIAESISGKNYLMEDNPLLVETLRIDFDSTAAATLSMTLSGSRPSIIQPIGLDDVYRLVPGEYGLPQGARGYWADERTFICEYDEIAASDHLNLKLTFQGDGLKLEALETDHEHGVSVQGRVQD